MLQSFPLPHSLPKKNKKHIIMHILNYNRSFLLDTDSFSFIVFKRLYHASFKLNIVSFSRALPYGPLLNPLRGSDCAHRLIVSCKTQNFFSLLMPWFHITFAMFSLWYQLHVNDSQGYIMQSI